MEHFFNDKKLCILFSHLIIKTSLKDKGSGSAGFNFNKEENELFLPIKLDGGLFKHQNYKVADFLIYYKKEDSNLKVIILELKGRIKNNKPEEQIESTINLIKDTFPFIIPRGAEILKIAKTKGGAPKKRNKKIILYLSDDKNIAKRMRG